MLRVDFREALTVVWCFSVLRPENQASGCGVGENEGLLSHVGCGGTPERWGMG